MEIENTNRPDDVQDIGSTKDFSQLCRICATFSDCLLPIFEDEGVEHELESKIHKHLPIKVSSSDNLPVHVCYQCASTIIAWNDLVVCCLEADKKLHQLIVDLEREQSDFHSLDYDDGSAVDFGVDDGCDDSYNSNRVEDVPGTSTHVETSSVPPPQPVKKRTVRTRLSHKTYGERKEGVKTLREEKQETASEERSPLLFKDYQRAHSDLNQKLMKNKLLHNNIKVCKLKFPAEASANNSCQNLNNIAAIVDNGNGAWRGSHVNINSDINIQDSELSVTSLTTLEQQKYTCDICSQYFNRAYDLKRHKVGHTVSGTLKNECEVTDKQDCKSDTKSDSVNSSNKNSTVFLCDICAKMFKLKDSYERHRRIHTGERPFVCNECGKSFRDSGGLSRHVNDVHAKIRKHPCDICNKWFANRATLDDHRRTHTGERPYVCHKCGKKFKSKASLYIHNKVHFDVFPHVCMYCEKQFRRKQELIAHVTTHTGEKSHICDKCGKAFRVRGELLRHMLIHSDDKPYVCVECGLNFRQKRYLRNHTRTRHGRTEEMKTEDLLQFHIPFLR